MVADTKTQGVYRPHLFAIGVCMFASLGGLFFGYDQGVTGGAIVMNSFLKDFCIGYGGSTEKECKVDDASSLPSQWLTFTTLYNVLYYIGCVGGAFFANFVCDKYGRRWTIFFASTFFSVGTVWVIATPAHQHTVALIGRIVEGVGVGSSSFSVPIYASEMAPKHLRGMLSGFMQMAVVTGILLSGIINKAVENLENGWRITNGVVLAAPAIIMLGIFFLPESPRWEYQNKSPEVAKATLQRLRRSDNVDEELSAIGDALEEEGYGVSTYAEVFHPSVRRRLYIAIVLQLLQQATGINAMFTYGGVIFKQIVDDPFVALLILGGVNFISTIPALYWVDRFGRRTLLLIGGIGMVVGHVVSGLAFTFGCTGNADESTCSPVVSWTIVAFTAFFIFNFAISWGPICWIYPAEIFPTKIRAKAVSLSTMTNWGIGALMIAIPKLFPYLNINGVFFLFAVLCAGAGTYVYFMCPETKGLLLEEIELLFNSSAKATTIKNKSDQYVETKSPKSA